MLRKQKDYSLEMQEDYECLPLLGDEQKSTNENKQNLENTSADHLLMINSFLSFKDMAALSRSSKKLTKTTNNYKLFFEKKASEHCQQKQYALNTYLITNINVLNKSIKEFKKTVTENYHVNIFKSWYDFQLDHHQLSGNRQQAMKLYSDYIYKMESDLNKYQCSLRSFICCTGSVGFQPKELPEGSCSYCCSKAGCFNLCCDPSMNLRFGVPQILVGGLTALFCPPAVPCFILQNGLQFCVLGIPAKIGHEYRLYKTRKLFNENEVVKLIKKYSFLQKKQKEFNQGVVIIDLDQPNSGPSRQEMS